MKFWIGVNIVIYKVSSFLICWELALILFPYYLELLGTVLLFKSDLIFNRNWSLVWTLQKSCLSSTCPWWSHSGKVYMYLIHRGHSLCLYVVSNGALSLYLPACVKLNETQLLCWGFYLLYMTVVHLRYM